MIISYEQYVIEKRVIADIEWEDEFDKLVDYALAKHVNQFRKIDGHPYVEHPTRVAKLTQKLTNNKTLTFAAFIHDVLEDTDGNWKEIAELFGKDVAKIVQELTSKEKEIQKRGKEIHLLSKMMKMSDDALTIKLIDRLDNIQDLKDPRASKKWSDNYVSQTKILISNLTTARNLSPVHNRIINQITGVLNSYSK
jgi:(p)ppGpp synthase/HD superfamily hydrolase